MMQRLDAKHAEQDECPLERLLQATLASFQELKSELRELREKLGGVEKQVSEIREACRPGEQSLQGKRRILFGPIQEAD